MSTPKIAKNQKPLKAMSSRSDAKYTGPEPEWKIQPDSENRVSSLSRAFGWYHYSFGKKEAKELLLDYLIRTDRQAEAKLFGRVPEQAVNCTIGWVSRMNLRGLELLKDEQNKLEAHIADLITIVKSSKEVVEVVEETLGKPNIQDRLREKATEVAGELEGLLDTLISEGVKITADHKPINVLRGMNISPQYISVVRDSWQRHRDEFAAAMEGKDSQLVEAYNHFGKIQLRNLVKFAEQVLSDCDSYVQIKKVERKPRKKKPASPEKLTAKFKYLREFAELKLTSESVTKLVGAGEAWLYDTKKRKLIHVVADQHVGEFTVKGSAIVGFDSTASVQKTLRKPAEQIKALMTGGAPAARKVFKDIKSTESKFNGRGNENLILLRVR
jgi:hypothetical protein